MSPEQPSTQSAEMPRQDTLGFFSDTSPAFRLKVLQATVVMDVWWNCHLARPATPSPSLTCQCPGESSLKSHEETISDSKARTSDVFVPGARGDLVLGLAATGYIPSRRLLLMMCTLQKKARPLHQMNYILEDAKECIYWQPGFPASSQEKRGVHSPGSRCVQHCWVRPISWWPRQAVGTRARLPWDHPSPRWLRRQSGTALLLFKASQCGRLVSLCLSLQ
ncbi:uncharacterized protein LOC117802256 [Ailuropoda melanoleuca]|uniref:uncharacterized protein LOC117802256 n=1 Tax=Ailuropoda melanoleuca TaxID=9646 RepID=UPI001494ABB8|nr:uncharacterized protein LOC117802256 [Ailuropoda melanoleuca]